MFRTIVEGESGKGWLYYKYLLLNTSLSRFGTSSFNLIILWIILAITHSALLSGLGDGMISLPLFFSFLVGAFIERSKRRKSIAIVASAGRALSFSLVFVGFYIGNPIVITLFIYVVAFFLGLTSDILNSVRSAWIKQFLTEDLYKKGISMSQALASIAEGAGFIAAGLLILLGFERSFIALIFVFALAVIPFVLVRPVENGVQQSITSSVREGISFIKGNKKVYQVLIIAFIANLIFGMAGILFTAFVQLHLKLSSSYLSMIFFSFIIGTVIGSIAGSKVKGRLGIIGGSTFGIVGISLLSVSFLNSVFLTLIPGVVIGVLIGILNVGLDTTFVKIIPQELMARIQGAFTTFSLAATFFSGTLGGIVIDITSSTEAFLVMGIAIICILPLFAIFREFSTMKVE